MSSHAPSASPAAGESPAAPGQLVAGMLLPITAASVTVTGLIHDPGSVSGLHWVTAVLLLVWALAASINARAVEPPGVWPLSAAVLAAAVALAASLLATLTPATTLVTALATLASALVVAFACHYLLALPGGRLGSGPRLVGVALSYIAAGACGLAAVATGGPLSPAVITAGWLAVMPAGLIAVRLRYPRATARQRNRLQWLWVGLVTAADAAVLIVVVRLLTGWPGPLAAVAAGFTVAAPLTVLAGTNSKLAPHGARMLVYALSAAGFSLVVAAVYLLVVLGLGGTPRNAADRSAIGLSMLAAALAAVGYLATRGRLADAATRFVYGAREAPDEVLRTFGTRMTRAVAMDELLLQLAESLRKTMSLVSAEVYTGGGDVLERAVAVPAAGHRSILLSERERLVVARAGVSGSAWTSIWLPTLLDGRERSQLRVAPISHGGELLGLIVIERSADADLFSEEDDRVLRELARGAGLAFHNVQLDAALQTTLDALRKQAEELRESRVRIVASADAERRRVERDLHDGAQQNLVALAVNLRLTQEIIGEDPQAGAEMLGQLATDVQATITELRDLAHGIYPPLLADSGLGEALRAAAGRATIPVRVQADGIGRYAQAVETAVYFCCLEAIQNAAKHAPQATADLRVWEEAGGLLFSVSDNGPGFDPAKTKDGHGFVNMADRLGAFGGTVRWDSEPGQGSTISGSVPIL